MNEQVLEGTWEEISSYAQELAGRRVRLTILSEEPKQPNQAMLAAMRKIAERHKDKPLTSGKDSQELLRKARDGGMFGYDPQD